MEAREGNRGRKDGTGGGGEEDGERGLKERSLCVCGGGCGGEGKE